MLSTLLLATALSLAPGIRLVDQTEELQDLVTRDEPLNASELDRLSVPQLTSRVKFLNDSKPTLVAPLIMIPGGSLLGAAGITVAAVGLYIFGAASGALYVALSYLLGAIITIVGIVGIAGGAALIVFGILKIKKYNRRGPEIQTEIDDITARLQRPPVEAAPPLPPPPLPPPTEPGTLWLGPQPSIVLATF